MSAAKTALAMTGLPGMARRLLYAVVLVAGVAFLMAKASGWRTTLPPPPPDTQAAVQFLKREELGFLVTERVVTQVVVEKHKGNLLFGKKDGYLLGTVELLYGVNLAQLDPTAISSREGTLHVRVPEPQLLRSVINEGSLRFLQKRSPLFALVDDIRSDYLFQESLQDLGAAAARFAESSQLTPSRQTLVGRLNGYAPAITAQTGVPVVFE